MKAFLSFILKEARHILRDQRTLLILFGMPVVMMFLFGFAISTEVKNVRIVVVASSMDKLTQQITDRLNASEYFDVTAMPSTSAEAKQMLSNHKAEMAIVFSQNFANHRYNGDASVQIIVDCTDPNMAIQQTNYASQIISAEVSKALGQKTPVSTKLLYNPQMRSAYNFVPGIMGMLLMIICAMMTSISIVREKEKGTMEVLLVSPVRPLMIIIAKAVPYFVLSVIVLACILLISHFVLLVPLSGNLLWIALVSMLFILVSLSLGLFISVVANTQVAAMLFSGMILLMPSMLLSGMIYPIESMPKILQFVAYIVPGSWFISAIRKLMIMGVGVAMVWKEILVLTGMVIFFMTFSLSKFKTRLE